MRSLLAFSILGLAAIPGAAYAESLGRPCTDKPASAYLSLQDLKAKLAEQGYQIRSGEIRKACGEFYVLDKNGKKAELFVDPTTGKIVAGDGKGVTGMTGDGNDKAAIATDAVVAEAVVPRAAEERDGDDKDGDDR